MDQRTQFIADYLRDVWTVVELTDRYGISRKTGYKWIDRYEDGGPGALVDRSRRPQRCPHETAADLIEAILALRRRHPTWGPQKLRHVLRTIADLLQPRPRHAVPAHGQRHPRAAWPAR